MLDFSVNMTRNKPIEPHHLWLKIERLSALHHFLVAGLMQALQLVANGLRTMNSSDLGEPARQAIDYLPHFGECHHNNLICTTYPLTDDTIVSNFFMFLLLLLRSIPSPQACNPTELRYLNPWGLGLWKIPSSTAIIQCAFNFSPF